jgi:hypothetical protein
MPRRKIYRRWPIDHILESYFTIRQGGWITAAGLDVAEGGSNAPPAWLIRLCEVGVAIAHLHNGGQEAVGNRYDAWLEYQYLKREHQICARRLIKLHREKLNLKIQRLELIRRKDKIGAAYTDDKIRTVISASADRRDELNQLSRARNDAGSQLSSATDAVAYQDAMSALCATDGPASLVMRGVITVEHIRNYGRCFRGSRPGEPVSSAREGSSIPERHAL